MTNKKTSVGYAIFSVIMLLLLLGSIVALTLYTESATPDSSFWNTKRTTQTYPLPSDMENLEFNLEYADIVVRTTEEEPHISIDSSFQMNCTTSEENGIYLVSVAPIHSVETTFLKDMFSNHKMPKVEIFLPLETLHSVSFRSKASFLDVSGIQSKQLSVDVKAGQASITDSAFETAQTKIAAGDLKLAVPPGTTSLKCSVEAGNMDLDIPEGLDGFAVDYAVNAGNIDDATSYDVSKTGTYVFWSHTGDMTYGDKSLNMQAKVTMGNLTLGDYTPTIAVSQNPEDTIAEELDNAE